MKKLNYLIAVLVMAILLPSCNQISKLAESASGGLSMDSEGAAADIVECLGKIDQNQWRVLSLTIRADGSQDECSNTLGNIYAYMINSDDQIVFQNLWPNVTAPEPKGGNFYKNKKFAGIPELKLTVDDLKKNIEACKAMLPEEYKFLSLFRYEIELEKNSDVYTTGIVMNVQEKGKETISANGVESGVYYEVKFEISPDGKVTIKD